MTFSPSTLQPLGDAVGGHPDDLQRAVRCQGQLAGLAETGPGRQPGQRPGSQDYLSTKAVTNNWSVVDAVRSRLPRVQLGAGRCARRLGAGCPHCFMVTNLVVEPAATAGSTPTEQTQHRYLRRATDPAGQWRGSNAGHARPLRRRMGGRYGGRNPRMMPHAACRRRSSAPCPADHTTILDEKPLRFTLSVQAVKLKPAANRLSMQFLKKHYEKVLLSIVLLGLAGAAAALPWQVSHERDRLEEIQRNLTVKVKAQAV